MKNTFNSVDRVEQLAAQRGIAVSRLALECDINPSTIATAKSRGCQLNLDTIIRICDHLDLPLGEFFRPADHTEVICTLWPAGAAPTIGGKEHHDKGSRL